MDSGVQHNRVFKISQTNNKKKWQPVNRYYVSEQKIIASNMMSHYELVTTYTDDDVVFSHGYRLIKKLGEGSYANVFLAEFFDASNLQKPVQRLACKIIDTMKAPKDYVTKFLPRELEVLRKLNHPHIIHIHSMYQKNTKYLIFMRYAENGDLLDFTVRTGAVLENQARMWVKQLSLAIQYLHELEIAHRDIKCENILITANFNVKLADFGFSRYVLNKKGIRTLSETYCGSTSYSAPEILKGIPYNPKVSDIWSLGVVIFVMMNKAMPFDDFSVKKLYEQQINKKWKFKSNIDSVVSRQVKDLLHNLLEPNVEKRYTIFEVLNSEWIFMDHRLLGMSEEENLALVNAKEERKKMDESFLNSKSQGKKIKNVSKS